MLEMNRHGGRCCGIKHIHNFNYNFNDKHFEELKTFINLVKTGDVGDSYLYEVVLIDEQLKGSPTLQPSLETLGFRLVTRFKNAGTGSMCNVFHHCDFKQLEG